MIQNIGQQPQKTMNRYTGDTEPYPVDGIDWHTVYCVLSSFVCVIAIGYAALSAALLYQQYGWQMLLESAGRHLPLSVFSGLVNLTVVNPSPVIGFIALAACVMNALLITVGGV